MLWFEDECLERYPCIAAHLMCEKDVYQLAPAEAALVIRDVKYGYRSEHEWIGFKYDGDARKAVRRAVRNRRQHSCDDYKLARALIELALEGAL